MVVYINMKNLALAIGALAIGTTLGVVGLKTIDATTGTNFPIIQNLAEKFNTSPEDVRGIFDQTREERQQERQKAVEDSLNQAVEDGKITEDQKNTILSKQAEIRKQMEEVKAGKEDLRKWADENDIDLKDILPGKGSHGFRGMKGL